MTWGDIINAHSPTGHMGLKIKGGLIGHQPKHNGGRGGGEDDSISPYRYLAFSKIATLTRQLYGI